MTTIGNSFRLRITDLMSIELKGSRGRFGLASALATATIFLHGLFLLKILSELGLRARQVVLAIRVGHFA